MLMIDTILPLVKMLCMDNKSNNPSCLLLFWVGLMHACAYESANDDWVSFFLLVLIVF